MTWTKTAWLNVVLRGRRCKGRRKKELESCDAHGSWPAGAWGILGLGKPDVYLFARAGRLAMSWAAQAILSVDILFIRCIYMYVYNINILGFSKITTLTETN